MDRFSNNLLIKPKCQFKNKNKIGKEKEKYQIAKGEFKGLKIN